MYGEGDVFDHHQDISNGNSGQDQINRIVPHILVTQNNNVQKVEQSSKNADKY